MMSKFILVCSCLIAYASIGCQDRPPDAPSVSMDEPKVVKQSDGSVLEVHTGTVKDPDGKVRTIKTEVLKHPDGRAETKSSVDR